MHTGLLINDETYDKIKDLFYTKEIQKNYKEYMEDTKETMIPEVVNIPSVQVASETCMIMDEIPVSEANNQSREAMESAISTDQMKKFEAMAKAWKEAHAQKIRKFDKVGRNDPCPCGSKDKFGKPIKYKNCCLNSGKYEGYKNIKK